MEEGTGQIKGRVAGETIAAQMVDTRTERDAATSAAGGANKRDIRIAIGTKKRRLG